ncbi:unnamed protein product [Lactuca virosa]|uniref:Uncharacterized protein n=1 Tax=Lactuca virosa TaxID=75947 RepID=A0AAU9PIU3_9ASTR|nr:unnamed protein product [Lactuca virosa]
MLHQVEDGVQVDTVEVEDAVHVEVQVNPVQVDYALQVDNAVQMEDAVPEEDAIQVDVAVPAQPIATGKRIRKYAEGITKKGLRRTVLKNEEITDHHPMHWNDYKF